MAKSIIFGECTLKMSGDMTNTNDANSPNDATNPNNPTNTNHADIVQPVRPKDVDLGGDVSLIFGVKGCQVRIKVQKALLFMVSTYFRALFSPGFSEGNTAGADIELDEDEPDAIVNLMKILHMQYTWPIPMTALELVSLAVVADKYDCVKAIQLSLGNLFPSIPESFTAKDMVKLAAAAYLFDNPHFFRACTFKLLISYPDSVKDFARLETAQHIPLQAWCK